MKNKLTKKEIELMPKIRDKWIDIAFNTKINKEEARAGVKWLYYISNLKEPSVVFVNSPEDFAKKFGGSVRDSVGASVRDSVWASVRDSVRASVRDSVGDSVRASVRASVGASVGASVWASVRDSVRDSVGASVGASVRASVRDSVGDSVRASVGDSVGASVRDSVGDSISWTSLCYDADWASWYDYFRKIKVVNNTKVNKYLGFLKSGAFYCMFFEKKAFIMSCPTSVKQDERKRLHSLTSPALEFKGGFKKYYIHGVEFTKEWWEKIVKGKLTAQEVFAIDNIEHRRVAYECMDKSKMTSLKDFKVLDEQVDEKGNKMKVVSFNVQNMKEDLIFLNVICPSTKREYYLGTDQKTCKEAKAKSFGLDEIEFVDEW
jgi:hypothetical protein